MPSSPASELTVVLPTYNRSHQVVAQLRLFAAGRLFFPLVIADSRDATDEAIVGANPAAAYVRFAPDTNYYVKMAQLLKTVATPFVLLAADKKIAFPHAVAPLLDHIRSDDACVASVGYVLRFERQGQDFDVFRVALFTPSIDDREPLRRMYDLMRRYQPSAFAVFRTKALAHAFDAACRVRGQIFQELMFMNALVVQGAVARLPVIFNLHGAEQSHGALERRNPLQWFVQDPRSFFRHYLDYRTALAQWLHNDGIAPRDGVDLDRLIDMIHATWLGHEVDTGVLNHATRQLLGDPLPPLAGSPDFLGFRPPQEGDLVHLCRGGRRRYVWRRAVLEAEPRAEITIAPDQIAAVEQALDVFFPD